MGGIKNDGDGTNCMDSVNVKSIVLTAKGSLECVKVTEWPVPKSCKGDEIRVAVKYCGLNFADLYHVQGKLIDMPVPYVLGLECVGVITKLGSQVKDFHVGDRVVCYKPFGGLFQHEVVVQQDNCFTVPDDIASDIACTLIANYLTAYFALFELGNLKCGQSVLIHSAAGGVGWAATQLASTVKNVTIYGTSSSSKHEAISGNGVSMPLTHDNYTETINKPMLDIVIDNIGGPNVNKSLSLVKHFGKVILTGANCVMQENETKVMEALQSLGTSTVPLRDLVTGNKSVCGLHLGTLLQDCPGTVQAAVQHIFQLCQQGVIKPRVHAVVPFHHVAEALCLLMQRKNIGKILLEVQ